ncbi:hypothetical protein GOODEAATRI_013313, partial [Goodea atripinnis]
MKFALVSWSKGKDKDALSIIPVNWIVDFDPENSKKEYLIECRSIGGRRPTNGWLVEPAHILQLADIPSLLVAVKTLVSDKITESSSYEGESEYVASVAQPSPAQLASPKPASVQLGNDDSTRVSAHCWETAKAQPTAKGMARTLLLGLFSVDVLLKSNLTGGVNKVNPSAERRQPLDPKKLKALL